MVCSILFYFNFISLIITDNDLRKFSICDFVSVINFETFLLLLLQILLLPFFWFSNYAYIASFSIVQHLHVCCVFFFFLSFQSRQFQLTVFKFTDSCFPECVKFTDELIKSILYFCYCLSTFHLSLLTLH